MLEAKELVNRIQFNNDEAAFNSLYKLFVKKLFSFAYTFLNDKESSEEIVNDVFVKVWLSRHRLQSINNIQTYLYVAVKNGCLSYLRSPRAKKMDELNVCESFYFTLPADPAQLLMARELDSRLLKAVNELPPKCKLIFKMVKEDGLTSKEVGVILNLSHKTVFAQLAIALKKIADVVG